MTQQPSPTHEPSGGDGSATDALRQGAAQAGATASQEASRLRGEASNSVRTVADEARSHVRGIADTAAREVTDRADEQVVRAGVGLRRTSEQLQALSRGEPDQAGPLADYAASAATAVAGWADRLEDRGIQGVAGDLSDFARRRPGQFLAGALVAGIVAGRIGRTVQAADIEVPDGSDSPTAGAGAAGDRSDSRNAGADAAGERPDSRTADARTGADGDRTDPDRPAEAGWLADQAGTGDDLATSSSGEVRP